MKQTGFYILSLEEEQALLEFLQKDSNVVVVGYKTQTEDLDIRKTMPSIKEGHGYFHCYLWNADISPRPVTKFIPTQNHFIIDDYKSEMIELRRCTIREEEDGKRWVNAGRIAIDHKLWIDGNLVERPKEFIAFFEKARKWIKKNAVDRTRSGNYIFPSVAKFLDEGGTFGAY